MPSKPAVLHASLVSCSTWSSALRHSPCVSMPRQSNIAGQSCDHLVVRCCVILIWLGLIPCSSAPAPLCPGLQNGVCTAACQSATCSALASFFISTFNETRNSLHNTLETKSWANRSGWDITRTQPCQQILSARGRSPSYCSWYGITCCTAEAAAQQECRSVHSVVEVKVQVNGVNGSVQDPTIVQNILQLHACGLTRLSLQGNDLSGALSSTWGSLTNLTVLDLSEYYCHCCTVLCVVSYVSNAARASFQQRCQHAESHP